MNICYFAPNIPYQAPHAGYTHTINVCQELQKKGNMVLIIFQGEKYSEFKQDNINIITVTNWGHEGSFSIGSLLKSLPILTKLVLICRKYSINLIHERSGLPRGLGIIAAKILRIKSIAEINSPFIEEYEIKNELVLRIWRKLMFKLTNRVLTQTSLLKKILTRDIHGSKIEVVSNGVNSNFFDPNTINGNRIRTKYNIQKDTILLIFVGAFHPWHGVDKIIKIAELMKTENLNVKILAVGTGPLFAAVKKEVNSKKLNDVITLSGAVNYSEIPNYIAAADIAIAPFSIHGFKPLVKYGFWWCPVKLFEYLAMAKPVISISAGDIPKIVPHNRAGLLSSPYNSEQLILNVKSLINSKELRQKLGAYGRQYIIKNYTWDKLAEKINKIYSNL